MKGAGKLAGKAKGWHDKVKGLGLFQNLEQQDELQNLITLKGAGKLAGKAKAAGFFQNLDQGELQNLMSQKEASYLTGGFFQNLDQDDELQNLIGLGKVGKIAGKAGKAYLTKGLFQNLE